jgi:tetratricopeptide (TPR) repeat protein
MILFLDNAESILDPQGPEAREIYTLVGELSQFSNISLCITSRISTLPPYFKRPTIQTLSMESASDIFYSIYENGGRSDVISDLVRQLDFHALSITLLATTALHNMWDYDRLAKEWDVRRGKVLRTDYDESLASTIELSLASPTFRKLGPEARNLLGVIAFFPQGVDEKNLDWLFPTISDRETIFDKFCVLSLTYRSNGFITMLAPIRDHLSPPDPKSSPLLSATKDRYFGRLSRYVNPGAPGFEEARWITSEDVNVEHLLNIFISLDTESGVVWNACADFFAHLCWYKPRYTVLGPKIEGLPDDHLFKPNCLFHLSRLYFAVGNFVEGKRLLTDSLKLERKLGSDHDRVSFILRHLSITNLQLGLYAEGIEQAREAVGILERLGDTVGQAGSLNDLAQLLNEDGQLDAAEGAAYRAISLLPEQGENFFLSQSHQRLGGTRTSKGERQSFFLSQSHHRLGEIYTSKGEREKAIHHFEIALGIASPFEWHNLLFWINYSLMQLFIKEGKWDDANAIIERAKAHTDGDKLVLGYTMDGQATIWFQQGRLEDATSEALAALKIFKELGASEKIKDSERLLQRIERARTGELLEIISLPMSVYPPQNAVCASSSVLALDHFITFPVLSSSLSLFCGTFYFFYSLSLVKRLVLCFIRETPLVTFSIALFKVNLL